jgi:hypothetical protein
MSDNRFVFDGLEELKEELRNLPSELAAEAGAIVTSNAEAAVADVRVTYAAHVASGHLLKGLFISTSSSAFGAGALVRNSSPIAWIFENGSQARHWKGGKGTGAMWGKTSQPPTHTFIRAMMKHRARMYDDLRWLLKRHGLDVTGEP